MSPAPKPRPSRNSRRRAGRAGSSQSPDSRTMGSRRGNEADPGGVSRTRGGARLRRAGAEVASFQIQVSSRMRGSRRGNEADPGGVSRSRGGARLRRAGPKVPGTPVSLRDPDPQEGTTESSGNGYPGRVRVPPFGLSTRTRTRRDRGRGLPVPTPLMYDGGYSYSYSSRAESSQP